MLAPLPELSLACVQRLWWLPTHLPLVCVCVHVRAQVVPSSSDTKRFSLRVTPMLKAPRTSNAPPASSLNNLASTASLPGSVTRGGTRNLFGGGSVRVLELLAPTALDRDRWVHALQLLATGDADSEASLSMRAGSSALSSGGRGSGAAGASFGVSLEHSQLVAEGDNSLRVPAVLSSLWEALQARPPAEGIASEGAPPAFASSLVRTHWWVSLNPCTALAC